MPVCDDQEVLEADPCELADLFEIYLVHNHGELGRSVRANCHREGLLGPVLQVIDLYIQQKYSICACVWAGETNPFPNCC